MQRQSTDTPAQHFDHRQLLAAMITLVCVGVVVYPELFTVETFVIARDVIWESKAGLVLWFSESNSMPANVGPVRILPPPSSSRRCVSICRHPDDSPQAGKMARQEWMLWKSTAHKVLLFAAILVVIAALEQELMELLELFMTLRNRDVLGPKSKGGLDMSLVPQSLCE